jgi:hypothetical protein
MKGVELIYLHSHDIVKYYEIFHFLLKGGNRETNILIEEIK